MDKTIRLGEGPYGSTFCRIEFNGGNLSITGVEGPKRNGDARGSCGQIIMHEWEFTSYAPGWNPELVARFREVWNRWHLNGSAWLREEVPAGVIAFLESLPDTDITPAWV